MKPPQERMCCACGGWDATQKGYDGYLDGAVLAVNRSYYPSVEHLCPVCTVAVEKFIMDRYRSVRG